MPTLWEQRLKVNNFSLQNSPSASVDCGNRLVYSGFVFTSVCVCVKWFFLDVYSVGKISSELFFNRQHKIYASIHSYFLLSLKTRPSTNLFVTSSISLEKKTTTAQHIDKHNIWLVYFQLQSLTFKLLWNRARFKNSNYKILVVQVRLREGSKQFDLWSYRYQFISPFDIATVNFF